MLRQRLLARTKRSIRKQRQRKLTAGLETLEARRLLAVTPIHQYSFSETTGTVFGDTIGGTEINLIDLAGSGTNGGGGGHDPGGGAFCDPPIG